MWPFSKFKKMQAEIDRLHLIEVEYDMIIDTVGAELLAPAWRALRLQTK